MTEYGIQIELPTEGYGGHEKALVHGVTTKAVIFTKVSN